MNVEYFISKRLISSKSYKNSISAPIIKITILAVAISVFMMLISVATGTGLQVKIREKIAIFNGHIIISNFDDNQSQVSKVPISTQQSFYPNFDSVPSVTHIQAVANKAGIIRTEKDFEGIIVKGVGADYNFNNLKEYIVTGEIPNYKKELTNQVLISEYLANRLQLKLNDTFQTYFIKENGKNLRVFTVSGIYNTGFQEFDQTFIVADIRHIQKINKWNANQTGHFEVFIDDFNQIDAIGNQIYNQIPAVLNSTTIKEKYANTFEWLQLFDFNIIVILLIMLLVATINMAVALLVLILERTQMIGILKAIGANNWSIRKIFIYNATYIITRGLLLGNITALAILFLQKYVGIIQLPAENYYVTQAPVNINILHLVSINLGTIGICVLIMLLPSYIITKIAPVNAIKN